MAARPPTYTLSPTNSNSGFKPGYLNAFQKLGPSIYFYHPNFQESNCNFDPFAYPTAVPEPNLIIICSWMGARARHIAKYTNPYIHRYPTIPILLIRNSLRDVMWTPAHTQLEDMSPAITAIQSVFASITTEPRVLVHLFSNGGGWSAGILTSAYSHAMNGLAFPITTLVLDSCPSKPRIQMSHTALSAALPRGEWTYPVSAMVLWVLLVILKVSHTLGVTINVVQRVRQELNEQNGAFIKGGVPRVYICSAKDAVVHLDDIKEHMEEAKEVMMKTGVSKEQADRRVVLEEFIGSEHVGHLQVDTDRYLRIMTRAWEVGIKCQIQNLQQAGSRSRSASTASQVLKVQTAGTRSRSVSSSSPIEKLKSEGRRSRSASSPSQPSILRQEYV